MGKCIAAHDEVQSELYTRGTKWQFLELRQLGNYEIPKTRGWQQRTGTTINATCRNDLRYWRHAELICAYLGNVILRGGAKVGRPFLRGN